MQTSGQSRLRIVCALEELVAQEAAALANRDFAAVLSLQERTAPLVDFLVTSPEEKSDEPDLLAHIGALLARRSENSTSLAAEIERTRAELEQVQTTRRRIAQIAPAYGHHAAAGTQCEAVG